MTWKGLALIIGVVTRTFRTILACILASALPLQAAAMAYVQAASSPPQASAPHAKHGHSHAQDEQHAAVLDHSTQDPCDDTGDGTLKCCHAHAVWLPARVMPIVSATAPPERRSFVSRWTSFIPEEPSPPPIALA